MQSDGSDIPDASTIGTDIVTNGNGSVNQAAQFLNNISKPEEKDAHQQILERFLKGKGLSIDDIEMAKILADSATDEHKYAHETKSRRSSPTCTPNIHEGNTSSKLDNGTFSRRTEDNYTVNNRSSRGQQHPNVYDQPTSNNPGKIMHSRNYGNSYGQQQHQHPQQYSYENMDTYDDDNDHFERNHHHAAGNIFASATVGGIIGGLTAAAINWLNGGDFNLFSRLPSPDECDYMDTIENERQSVLQVKGPIVQHENLREETLNSGDTMVRDGHETALVEQDYNASGGPLHTYDGYRGDEERCPVRERNELLSEMKSLKGVIQEHRETQERIHKEALRTAQKTTGNALTNKAMTKLRTVNGTKGKCAGVDTKEEFKMQNIGKHLEEIGTDLSSLKEILSSSDAGNAEFTNNVSADIDKVLSLIVSCVTNIGENMNATTSKEGDIDHSTNGNGSDVEENINRLQSDSKVEKTESIEENMHNTTNKKPIDTTHILNEYLSNVQEVLDKIIRDNNPDSVRSGAQMLHLYTVNLSNNPNTPRYRKLYTTNENFRQKVGDGLVGGRNFLYAVGFEEKGNYLEWQGFNFIDDKNGNLSEGEKMLIAVAILKSAASSLKDIKDEKTTSDREKLDIRSEDRNSRTSEKVHVITDELPKENVAKVILSMGETDQHNAPDKSN